MCTYYAIKRIVFSLFCLRIENNVFFLNISVYVKILIIMYGINEKKSVTSYFQIYENTQ